MSGKWRRILMVVAAIQTLLPVLGCASDSRPIENGTYLARSGEGKISVRDQEIHFIVTISHEGRKEVLDRRYNYTVLPDGRIQPHPVRSVDAAFGIGRYDWYWEGGEIVQRNPDGGADINTFVRKP
jgi:hypothetical protein